MFYIGKGLNTLNHVKGKNVWYFSQDKNKLLAKSVSKINTFSSRNDMFTNIHRSRLKVVEL